MAEGTYGLEWSEIVFRWCKEGSSSLLHFLFNASNDRWREDLWLGFCFQRGEVASFFSPTSLTWIMRLILNTTFPAFLPMLSLQPFHVGMFMQRSEGVNEGCDVGALSKKKNILHTYIRLFKIKYNQTGLENIPEKPSPALQDSGPFTTVHERNSSS